MIAPKLLRKLFLDNQAKIMESATNLTHEESVRRPAIGGNSIHWIVGHIVVGRCNFLTLLDVPSIWDWETCKLFVPGSRPSDESAGLIDFGQLLVDLDRTQEQLQLALKRAEIPDLSLIREDKSIAEFLAEYALHEAYHSGQLDLLSQAARRQRNI